MNSLKAILKLSKFVTICSILFSTISCSKDSTVAPEPEYVPKPDNNAIATFTSSDPYFELYIYRFDEATETWGKRIRAHYPTVSKTDTTYMGFTNPYVTDSGVNLFQMVTLYSDKIGTTNIKTAGINVDQVLQFLPDQHNSQLGKVTVKEQQVKIYKKTEAATERKDMEFFEISISGAGTYDLKQGLIDLEVNFNETAIGGSNKVTRKYKLSTKALEL
ncbi:hypothetical protein [Sphingobacterium zeae]|uniref:Uncharacterized protein n=1 Tax=Sphingobacterium zeae TaxID=1776859 RepID=A0ABU0U391_9SPHI|nr:hypothetical protein [Sphingobacterium zeae]MDQ1149421.1 hypothetical protein [Sphingobacterium zeae]